MKFLLDQSSDARLAEYLTLAGHDAARVGREHPDGIDDSEVLRIAHLERRVLITDDRDFGELVIRQSQPHSGVIYLRLGDRAPLSLKVSRLQFVLENHIDTLDHYLVVEPERVRVRSNES